MKTVFKSFLFLATAAMALVACNKTEIETPQNEDDFYYTFALGSPETRSILSSDDNGKFGAWENGDRLGTAVDDGKLGFSQVVLGDPVTFSIYKSGGLKEGETVYAYYPYKSSATSVAAVPMTIPASQNQAEAFDFDAMPMVAEGFVVPAELESETTNTPVGVINLLNLGSVIDFQVFSSNATYAEETILNVKFSASEAIAGEFTKDITAVQANNESTLTISGFTGKEVTTTVGDAPTIGSTRDAAAHVYMVVAPVSGITGSVIVTTNKAVYTYNLSKPQAFKRAGLKSFGLNLGTCENRVASEMNTTTFVFNTTDGIKTLGLDLPASNAGTNVERVVSDCIVLTGDKGTNDTYYPRVWNSNGTYNFRVNKNNTITFSVSEGTIKGISFEAGSNWNLTTEVGTLTGTNWEGSASTVTFTNTDAGRTDINTITISYTGGVAPIEPVALVMSDITCNDAEENENSLTFSWANIENASGYQVSTDGGNNYGEPQTECSYTWTGLSAGLEYTIYVKAVGDGTNYITSEAKAQQGKTKASENNEPYSTGFESGEGYTAGTNYQSTVTCGPQGRQWEVYYGNVTTSSKITDDQSLALRLYTTENYGYAKMNFDVSKPTKVDFKAKAATSNSAKILLTVYESVDGGNNWSAVSGFVDKELGSSASDYSYTVSGSPTRYRVKFCISEASTKPTTKNAQLTIDDFYITVSD